MFEIGQLVIKTAGRDAGLHAVIVEKIDAAHVIIDGETRRRKTNVKHLEPLHQTLPLKSGASHEAVIDALKTLNLEARQTKKKDTTARPRKKNRQAQPTTPAPQNNTKPAKQPETPTKSGKKPAKK